MLSVSGLCKSYESAEGDVPVIRGVSFDVPRGAFFTLVGPSGCGKTTTLRCIAGLESPDGGRIAIGGQVVSAPESGVEVPPYRRNIGMVFQSYAIWPHMDVFGNVAYPLRVERPRPPRAEIEARTMDALRLVGMEALARRPATRLSGGQQQRVAFARAMVRRPELLLLDEPLSNLDAKLREQMRSELQELVARTGVTTLYVTHDQAEALAMSDCVAVMSGGEIVQSGAPRDVYERPRDALVADFLGIANVLPGRVAAGPAVRLDGQDCTLRPGALDGFAPGAAVRVVFRPEDAALRTEPAPGTIAGRVERVSFQGSVSECHVRAGTALVRTLVHPALRLARGDRIWLAVDPARCVVLPGADAAARVDPP